MTAADVQRLARIRAWCGNGVARRIRLAARLSQAEVAAAIGCHFVTVSRYENGRVLPGRVHGLRYERLLSQLMASGYAP